MKFHQKAQFAVFDVGFMLFLFVSLNLLLLPTYFGNDQDLGFSSQNLNQILLYLGKDSTFRSNVFLEDISTTLTILNWNETSFFLDQHLSSYELRIGNLTDEKNIFTCIPGKYSKFSSIFLFDNVSSYQLREVILGVCE